MPEPTLSCPLCNGTADHLVTLNEQVYFHCKTCDLRFLDPKNCLSADQERDRYLLHQNSLDNLGYRNFLRPMVDEIMARETSDSFGLDFGSGPTPTLSSWLNGLGLHIDAYDLYFTPQISNRIYDYIICSEVIEHFRAPHNEFKCLASLLQPGGHLYVMTQLFDSSINFSEWSYRRDPTHISFYSEKTLEWISQHYNFLSLHKISPRIAIFTKH